MNPFSKSRQTAPGGYVAKRRRQRLRAVAIGAFSFGAITLLFFLLGGRDALSRLRANRPIGKSGVLQAWENGEIPAVRAMTLQSLAVAPLDPFYLAFRGFSAYYESVQLPEGEEKTAFIDEAITALRKSLTIGGNQPRSRIEYVLGKAYYGKGPGYYDLAVKYLEQSIDSGYSATDSHEYLALCYAGLGDRPKAVENFDAALSQSRTEMLLLAAAKANWDAGDGSKAESLLSEVLSSGGDALARQQCRLLYGDILRSRRDYDGAARQFMLAIESDPESAEAHYRLGVTYADAGDNVKARSEWRRAIAIDPMHAASRQKLSER